MSTAPRRVEDAVPAPAVARPKAGKNSPAGRFWHQGFLVQNGKGSDRRARVPFLLESTTRRVAARAARQTEIPMTVEKDPDGYWFYTPAVEPPAQREGA